jgi:peptidoglycan/LPS O-acetylase OafA/YrhL
MADNSRFMPDATHVQATVRRSPAHAANQDIEVLRGVAVGLTVITHLSGGLINWTGRANHLLAPLNLWGGVDLFFCISGFVIASSLLRQPPAARFRDLAIPFYIRRVFRIWPASFLWLLIPFLGALFFNTSGMFGIPHSVRNEVVAASLQVANIYFELHHGGKEFVYWSLSLEEQFYFVFPLLLYFMRPTHLRVLLAAVVVSQFFLHRPPEAVLWAFRTDAIALGVLIALAWQERRLPTFPVAWLQSRARGVVLLLPLVLMLFIALLSTLKQLWVATGLLAFVSAGLVLIASYDRDLIIPWRPPRQFLVWAGSRSFALYLAHNPCFWATREIFHRLYPATRFDDRFAPAFLVLAAVLLLSASEATYRLIETPLREVGRRLAARQQRGMAVSALTTATN